MGVEERDTTLNGAKRDKFTDMKDPWQFSLVLLVMVG
jgi:hypothetical protein